MEQIHIDVSTLLYASVLFVVVMFITWVWAEIAFILEPTANGPNFNPNAQPYCTAWMFFYFWVLYQTYDWSALGMGLAMLGSLLMSSAITFVISYLKYLRELAFMRKRK